MSSLRDRANALQVITEVLQDCGTDIDAAIRRLGELQLSTNGAAARQVPGGGLLGLSPSRAQSPGSGKAAASPRQQGVYASTANSQTCGNAHFQAALPCELVHASQCHASPVPATDWADRSSLRCFHLADTRMGAQMSDREWQHLQAHQERNGAQRQQQEQQAVRIRRCPATQQQQQLRRSSQRRPVAAPRRPTSGWKRSWHQWRRRGMWTTRGSAPHGCFMHSSRPSWRLPPARSVGNALSWN